jgi:hypothetical protein
MTTDTETSPEVESELESGQAVATGIPSRAELVAEFGDSDLSIQSLFKFCFVPSGRLSLLKELTVDEEWGDNSFVLLKYLAVHIYEAIVQGRYVWNGEQMLMSAGSLCTPQGTPIYLGLVRNSAPQENPWVINWVGERPASASLPQPPDLGEWPALDPRGEVVVAIDLTDTSRQLKIPGTEDLSPISQSCLIAGAVHWSLQRGLAVRQVHGGGRGYFVPLYLNTREDLTLAPDLAAPVVAQGNRLVVRTVLEPHVCYSPSRAAVERWEQLPPWLLEAWHEVTTDQDEEEDGGEEE